MKEFPKDLIDDMMKLLRLDPEYTYKSLIKSLYCDICQKPYGSGGGWFQGKFTCYRCRKKLKAK